MVVHLLLFLQVAVLLLLQRLVLEEKDLLRSVLLHYLVQVVLYLLHQWFQVLL